MAKSTHLTDQNTKTVGGQRAILEEGEVQSYEVVLQLAKTYFEQLGYKVEIENSEL